MLHDRENRSKIKCSDMDKKWNMWGIYLNQTKKNNYNSIHLGKLGMAILVVAIHTRPFMNCSEGILFQLYTAVLSLAVPYFFIASGFFIAI